MIKVRIKLLLILLLIQFIGYAQPKEEVRAVWITTVFNLDWPTTSGQTNQKNEMINLLNLLQAANFNTIMLQVRARGDLLYPSAIEPWAKAMTGTLGSNPGWDPLQFTIDEAHKRGIEVHAWWNVYKVYGTGTPPSTNPQHVVLSHPELCKFMIMNGGWIREFPQQKHTCLILQWKWFVNMILMLFILILFVTQIRILMML